MGYIYIEEYKVKYSTTIVEAIKFTESFKFNNYHFFKKHIDYICNELNGIYKEGKIYLNHAGKQIIVEAGEYIVLLPNGNIINYSTANFEASFEKV